MPTQDRREDDAVRALVLDLGEAASVAYSEPSKHTVTAVSDSIIILRCLRRVLFPPLFSADAPLLYRIFRANGLGLPISFTRAGQKERYPYIDPRHLLEVLSQKPSTACLEFPVIWQKSLLGCSGKGSASYIRGMKSSVKTSGDASLILPLW